MDKTEEETEKRGRSEEKEVRKRSVSPSERDSPRRSSTRRRYYSPSPVRRAKSPRRSRSPVRAARRSPPHRSRSPVRRMAGRRSRSKSRSPCRSIRNSRSPSPRFRRTGHKARMRSRSPRRGGSPRYGRRRDSPSRDRRYSPYTRGDRKKRRKSDSESMKRRRRYRRDDYSSSGGSDKGGSRSGSRKRDKVYGGRSTSITKKRVKRSPSNSYERRTDDKKTNCAALCNELLSFYESSMSQRPKMLSKCRDLFDDSKFMGEDAELNEYTVSQYLNTFFLEKEKKDVSKRIFTEANEDLSYCIEFEPKTKDQKGLITLFECSKGLLTRAYMFDDDEEIGKRGLKLDDKVLSENKKYQIIQRHLKNKGITDDSNNKIEYFD